jgi:hypothetical protein
MTNLITYLKSMRQSKETLDRYFAKRGGYKTLLEREEGWSEDMLCNNIATYLKENHPTVPFQFDMSGYKLSQSQANKASRQRADGFKVPDLTLYVKKENYGMLAIEVKKIGTKIYRLDGKLVSNKHIISQANSIMRLRKYGQCADFGVGYADVIKKINNYLDHGGFEYLLK